MADDGTVALDKDFEIDATEGTHVQLFALRDSISPGGYHRKFQYHAPEDTETILRYHNAHDSDIGPHHRHQGSEMTSTEFEGLEAHVSRFRSETFSINAQR
jgi:hypothetical protein